MTARKIELIKLHATMHTLFVQYNVRKIIHHFKKRVYNYATRDLLTLITEPAIVVIVKDHVFPSSADESVFWLAAQKFPMIAEQFLIWKAPIARQVASRAAGTTWDSLSAQDSAGVE